MCYEALVDDSCVGSVGRGGQSRGQGFADAGDSGLVRAVSRRGKRSLVRPAARDIEWRERGNSRQRSLATPKLPQPPYQLPSNHGMPICNLSGTVPSHVKQGGNSMPSKRASG